MNSGRRAVHSTAYVMMAGGDARPTFPWNARLT